MVDAPGQVTARDRLGRRLIRLSGDRLARTSGSPMPASTAIAIAPASASAISSWVTVLPRSSRLKATTACLPPESGCTRTRHESAGASAAGAVNGFPTSASCAADSFGASASCSGVCAVWTWPSALTTSTRN